MGVILSIDAGTTGVRALLVGDDAQVLAAGYHEFPQSFPRPGWVEHDPEDWWRTALTATGEALARSGLGPGDVAAVGITNQRETTVAWDRVTLRPLHPAIVWQDRRTAPLCEELRADGWDDAVRDRTGLVIDPYFSGTKMAWLLREVAEVATAARSGTLALGTVDAYLIARLTAGRTHATDRTNASRTMLFDIHGLRWEEGLLGRLGVPAEALPSVEPSVGSLAETDPEAFLGIRAPIAGVAGDQQAALAGQACFAAGRAKNTYGTGSFVLLHTGPEPARSGHGLLTTLAASGRGKAQYALEGSIFVTGAAVQWLRDGLGVMSSSADASALAGSVPDTDGVYFVPALTGLGAPWWDPHARGTIVGLTRGTTRAHLVRAAVEAMAYQTRDVVDAMTADAGVPLAELRVDGGATANDTMLQLQADLLGIPVVRAAVQETTALGAAFLAGMGIGVWATADDVGSRWRSDRTFEPRDRDGAETRYAAWRRAVERSLGWARDPGGTSS